MDFATIEHVDQIFRCNIAAGIGRERASANTANTGIQRRDTGKQTAIGVADACVTRVMKVRPHRYITRQFPQCLKGSLHLPWDAYADGIGQRDFDRPGIEQGFSRPKKVAQGHLAFSLPSRITSRAIATASATFCP